MREEAGSGRMKRSEGMFISHTTGFILFFLCMCLCVLVGLIVHFVSPGDVVCNCGNSAGVVPPLSPEELRGKCVELVENGNVEICTMCPDKIPSTAISTTQTKSTSTTTKIMQTTEGPTKPSSTTTTTTTTTTTAVPPTTPTPTINYRLPENIEPYLYTIELQPEIYDDDPELFYFNGSVAIIFNVTIPTTNVTLHKNNLNIDEASITLEALDASSVPKITRTSYEEVTNFYTLHLNGYLNPETRSYKVKMFFNATLTADGIGLFYTSYEADNKTVYLVSTQMQSNFARMVVPCFDEPALKAYFDITLVRKTTTDRSYITLSNTEIVSNENRGEYTADTYSTTPWMSTYLLAFIICDFQYYENTTSNVTYRTYVRPPRFQYGRRAHEYGLELFDWYEKTFEPSYPLNKLYNIEIPDYMYGGMENWGLTVYHEDILYEKGVSPADFDSWAVEVTSHEIAHNWFGNLVTMKWWWWAWMNEGFATFFEFHALQTIYPERRSTDQYVTIYMHTALEVDGDRDSHPLTNSAESTDEIEAAFDDITYLKGGFVVRMLYFLMGEDLFYRGLNYYLEKHQYGVVTTSDLWNDLTQATIQAGTPVNVRDSLDTLVSQANYPLVTATVVEGGVLNVRQERFLNNMSIDTTGDTAKYSYKWTVPITYVTSENTSNFETTYSYHSIDWLHHTERDRNITSEIFLHPSENASSWVLINLYQYGFYRVNYDDSNWLNLIQYLQQNETVIPPINRAQLINDAWALQKAGVLGMDIALRTLNILQYDDDYVPWRAFSREIVYLDAMLEHSALYGAFKEFMRTSTQKTYDTYRMNITEETLPIYVFQATRSASYACKYGNTECRAEAVRLYRRWMNDPEGSRPRPDLVALVTCNAVREGGVVEWNFAFDRYWNSAHVSVQSNVLLGMACATQQWLVKRMLEMTLDENMIHFADAAYLIEYISGEPASLETAWNFVKTNYQRLFDYLGSDDLAYAIREVTYGFNTEQRYMELETFANMTACKDQFVEPIKEALKSTRTNIQWMDEHHDVIKQWLIERGLEDYLL